MVGAQEWGKEITVGFVSFQKQKTKRKKLTNQDIGGAEL